MSAMNSTSYRLLFILAFCLTACSTTESEPPTALETDGVRLKHLTSSSQLSAALADHMEGYAFKDEGSFTDMGNYPAVPHVYYYTARLEQAIVGIDLHRVINAQAGMGDESKEEVLDYFAEDYEEILDPRLGKPPYDNVFALRYRENQKRNWVYELYIQLDHINQDNQVIHFSGGYGPSWNEEREALAPEPPSPAIAISTMLSLVETITP